MAKDAIIYDYDFMSAKKVGQAGYKAGELATLGVRLKNINQQLNSQAQTSEFSFRKLPGNIKSAKHILNLAKKLRRKFKAMVVIGIGGSDLGAKALCQALGAGKKGELYFCGDTTDPAPFKDLLAKLDLSKTIFYVVSKSGETIEPLSAFLFWRDQVIKKVGLKKHQEHFILTTFSKGALVELAMQEGYSVWPHYAGGGRFSALSVNGLLPAAWLGLDIKKLLSGAQKMEQSVQSNDYKKNLPFTFAALQYLSYTKRKQNIAVLMPYAASLEKFAFWYRQLWAESLGKAKNKKGEKVNLGITPVAAMGPADQHSQLQLYNEGPADKIVTFIKIEKQVSDLIVPKSAGFSGSYLSGHKFSEILNIELQATSVSLMKNKRPNQTLILPQLNEFSLGQLIYFYEMAVVYLGELLNVDVFGQPGVEQSKKIMRQKLGA